MQDEKSIEKIMQDLPKFSIPELEMPKLDFTSLNFGLFKPIALIDLNATKIQKFQNPSHDNKQLLSPIPHDIWLSIFACLEPKPLIVAMLTCKFFGEITNDTDIRNKLGKEKMEMLAGRFSNEKNSWESSTFNTFPRGFFNSPCQSDYQSMSHELRQENDLYQPEDNGFTMKK